MIKNIIISSVIVITAVISVSFVWDGIDTHPNHYPVLFNSCVGLLGVLFFLFRSPAAKVYIIFWSVLQLVVVELQHDLIIDLSSTPFGLIRVSELNFVQYIAYLPEEATFAVGGNLFSVNFVPFVYLLLLIVPFRKTVKVGRDIKRVAGEKFELKLFRWNKLMAHILPQEVEVVQRLDFGDSRDWLLVRLSKPVKFKNGRVIYNALIKPKDDRRFRKSQSGQLGYFRLLKSRKALQQENMDLDCSKFIDWVFVR